MKMFKNLFHVTMFVSDIQKSLDFYNKLGFEVLFEMRVEPGEKPWNYYLRVAHEQYIELQTIKGAAPNPHPAPEKVGFQPDQSLWHFALQTESIEMVLHELTAKGITCWSDPEKSGVVTDVTAVYHADDGCLVFWLIDPDGNRIEVMEQSGQTLQRKTDYLDE